MGYLGNYNFGFIKGSSKSFILVAYRFLIEIAKKTGKDMEVMALDMSRAFDTVDRNKLVEVLAGFVDEDEVRMVAC